MANLPLGYVNLFPRYLPTQPNVYIQRQESNDAANGTSGGAESLALQGDAFTLLNSLAIGEAASIILEGSFSSASDSDWWQLNLASLSSAQAQQLASEFLVVVSLPGTHLDNVSALASSGGQALLPADALVPLEAYGFRAKPSSFYLYPTASGPTAQNLTFALNPRNGYSGDYRAVISFVRRSGVASPFAGSSDLHPFGWTNAAYFTILHTLGSVDLGTVKGEFRLRVAGGQQLVITYQGAPVHLADWEPMAAQSQGQSYLLYWQNATNPDLYAVWTLDASGAYTQGHLLGLNELQLVESAFAVDINLDGITGLTFLPAQPSRIIGTVAFGTTSAGYAFRVNGGPVLHITHADALVSATNPGAGWSAISAAADPSDPGGGYDLYWKNNRNGSYARWDLDAAGNFLAGSLLSAAQVRGEETRYNVDLNGLNDSVVSWTSIRTIGSVSLGSTTELGYALRTSVGASFGNPLHISWAGDLVSASRPGAGWSAIAAAADPSDPAGGYDLFWKHANGSYARWDLETSGTYRSGTALTIHQFLAEETRLNQDIDGDSLTGIASSPAIGNVSLVTTASGYALRSAPTGPLQPIRHLGQVVSAANPGAGWSAITAAADPTDPTGGYDLYWRNNRNGSYARWDLDAAGNFLAGSLLSTPQLLAAETQTNADLNGDGITGLPVTALGNLGTMPLGSTSLGYVLSSGLVPPVHVTYGGSFVSAANPGNGWEALAAAADGQGFDLYWKNSRTQAYARWDLNASGAYVAGTLLTTTQLQAEEVKHGFDLNGDTFLGSPPPLAGRLP